MTKRQDPSDRRKGYYTLTDKGLELIPILVELANWGVCHDPNVTRKPLWIDKAKTDREGLYQLIRDTVSAGGAVFRGDNSVVSQLASLSNAPNRSQQPPS